MEREIAGENTLENFILYTEENSLETSCNEASFIIFFLGKSEKVHVLVLLYFYIALDKVKLECSSKGVISISEVGARDTCRRI